MCVITFFFIAICVGATDTVCDSSNGHLLRHASQAAVLSMLATKDTAIALNRQIAVRPIMVDALTYVDGRSHFPWLVNSLT